MNTFRKKMSSVHAPPASSDIKKAYSVEDLYKIIQLQQSTINKLTQELSKKSQAVPREQYERTLNELETEKYEHAKSRMELAEARENERARASQIEFFKSELDKERTAYANVFDLLKDKALTEGSKSLDLISKIAGLSLSFFYTFYIKELPNLTGIEFDTWRFWQLLCLSRYQKLI
jgi:hypothetical protein